MPKTNKKTFLESVCYLADSIYSLGDSINSGTKGVEGCGKSIESAGKEIGRELHYIGDNLKGAAGVVGISAVIVLIMGIGTCQVTSSYEQNQELQETRYQKSQIAERYLYRENRTLQKAYQTLERRIQDLEK